MSVRIVGVAMRVMGVAMTTTAAVRMAVGVAMLERIDAHEIDKQAEYRYNKETFVFYLEKIKVIS